MIHTSGFLPWINLGSVRIPTYFFVISLVLTATAFAIRQRAEKQNVPVRMAMDLFLVVLISGFVGSRLVHILWEEPVYYFENPLRIFDILAGGFVWYGGLAFGVLGFFFYTRRTSVRMVFSPFRWLDFLAPVTAFGYAGGRIACVLAGCCFGKNCDWPVPHQLPSQLFAVVWDTGLGFWLLRKERQSLGRGQLFALWLGLHGVGRVLMEVMRDDPRGPSLGPVTLATAVSIAIIVISHRVFKKSVTK